MYEVVWMLELCAGEDMHTAAAAAVAAVDVDVDVDVV